MLDKIIEFSIRNKFLVGLLTLIMVVWGIWSATKLPIDAVPDITNNQVQIITTCPTLAGQEVEQLVTFPIEQSIANLPDLEETRSISRFGLSVITVVFKDNVDIYFARQLIAERLNDIQDEIPESVGKPEMAPVSTGLGEIYQYILHPKKGSENKYSAKDLRTMQDWIVARQLYGTEGVAEVNSYGGELKQYEVAVNPDHLKAMNISLLDIFDALKDNNQNTGGAYIDKKPNAYFIRGIGIVSSLEDVANIPIKTEGDVPVLIKDVAKVQFGNATRYGALTYNGVKDAVGGVIMMLKGANSSEVVHSVKEKMKVIQQSLPDDVVVEPFLDRMDLINRAIHTVEKNLLEGAIIVIFVLILFLGNLRAGLIVASAIPLSLIFALGMMNVFGVSANLMSLGAIDFGLVVDGAVIIVEATLHLLAAKGITRKLTSTEMDEAVEHSAKKMMHSAVFGQIIILIVYIPILTLRGIEGKMFSPMAQTVSFAILGALLLSLTYIPMMSALFLSKNPPKTSTISSRLMEKLERVYQRLLSKAMTVKNGLIAGTVALFFVALFLFGRMGGEFIPQLQEGDFTFHCILPQGSSLSQSIETSMQASRIIRSFNEVKMVVGKTGSAEVPTDPMPPEATDLVIILKPKKEWKDKHKSYAKLSHEILEKLENIPGVFFEANQPIQMRFNELMTGVRQDVAVKIFGENLDSLAHYAQKTRDVVAQIRGVSAPQVEQTEGLPQITVRYDRNRLANYGISIKDVNEILSAAFAGEKAGQIYENERRFDLVVRLDSSYRKSIDDVGNLMVPTKFGTQIPLSQVAKIQYLLGPAQISRESSKRRIVVSFNVSGRDVQSTVHEVQQRLEKEIKLPVGYYFTYGGQFQNLQEASARLLIAVPVSLLLIFILLYFAFGKLKLALLIFTTIPMSAIGGVFALLIRDMPFSISAGIGFIALFGVAVLNGIVLIGTFNELEKEGVTDLIERVKRGTLERLRPVLMTATVASFGFLPMAISTSAGAEVQRPLATVVIGGLITATFLTLFILPLTYLLFHTKNPFKMRKLGLILLPLLCFSSLHAQEVELHSVDDAIALGLKNNLAVQAGNLNVQATQQLRKSVFNLPKLEFVSQLGQYSSHQFDNSFAISQTIPFPTQFSSQKKLIQAEIQAQTLRQELTENVLRQQIRTYYYQLQYLHNNAVELKRLDSLYLDFIRIATLQYQTGNTKLAAINTAKAQEGEIALLVQQNAVYEQNAKQNLQTLLGISAFKIAYSEQFQPLALETIIDTTQLKNHPQVQANYQEALVRVAQAKIEKATMAPDLILSYTNQSLIGYQTVNNQEKFFGARDRFSFFNIGISIPLTFGATSAKVRSLHLAQESAKTLAKQTQNELKTQLQNELQNYDLGLTQLNYYQQTALTNSDKLIADAKLSYQSGEIGFVEYLYTLETATKVRLNYLKTIQEINETITHIYSLLNK